MMRFTAPALAVSAAVLATLGGCVVQPARPIYAAPPPVYSAPPPVYAEPQYAPPPGVVYVAPTYAMPAPGFVWQFHGRYGWGWRHPHRGWHRGWR